MYAIVPTTRPGRVTVWSSPPPKAIFARPKSRSFTVPSRVIMMLSGLRSRCVIPATWAAASPPVICTAMSITRFTGTGPRSMTARSVSPSMNSDTRYGRPSTSPASKRVRMFGWFKVLTARVSLWNRERRSGEFRASGRSTLTATSLSRRRSRARKTSPMPPSPRRARSRYGPICCAFPGCTVLGFPHSTTSLLQRTGRVEKTCRKTRWT